MEEQTLRYYLKAFNIAIILILIISSFYIFNILNKNIILKNNPLKINKGQSLENIIKDNIINFSYLDIELLKILMKINNLIDNNFIHYGEFNIHNDSSIIDLINIISQPSNIINKITIVEGWSQKELNLELAKHFQDYRTIPYEDIIADTYYFNKNMDFNLFLKKLKESKKDYFNNYINYEISNQYTLNEIMIIGSLLEKEGLDYLDKKIISSVIFNRLNKNMKLQIDASVLYAITNGAYNLNRNLLLSDLKIDHPFNTYKYFGLPPRPISYVGKKTLDIIFENYKTEFLFYFFDNSLNRHVFSITYAQHIKKLNEYRKK